MLANGANVCEVLGTEQCSAVVGIVGVLEAVAVIGSICLESNQDEV